MPGFAPQNVRTERVGMLGQRVDSTYGLLSNSKPVMRQLNNLGTVQLCVVLPLLAIRNDFNHRSQSIQNRMIIR